MRTMLLWLAFALTTPTSVHAQSFDQSVPHDPDCLILATNFANRATNAVSAYSESARAEVSQAYSMLYMEGGDCPDQSTESGSILSRSEVTSPGVGPAILLVVLAVAVVARGWMRDD